MNIPTVEEVQTAVGPQYAVEGLHGHGGMGAVFRGRHRTLGSPVAIKVLPLPAFAGSEPLARFEREAKVAANLPHAHIVPVYEFNISNELAYIIMPFVEGISLAAHLEERRRLDLAELRELLGQVGSGLAFAHERGVVHRDVKPANLMRETATGRWLVTDFGIARARDAVDALTQSGMAVGTPAYMAPEQATGAVDIDGRADLYSLAAVACEALLGSRPDVYGDPARVRYHLAQARPDLPVEFIRALTSPLAMNRNDRPRTVAEWLANVDVSLGDARPAAGGSRAARTVVAGLTGAGIVLAIAVGWLRFASDGTTPRDGFTVAIAPLTVTGTLPAIDLAEALPRVLEEQISFIPGVRVVPASALESATADGASPAGSDALAGVAADRFGADEVVTGTVFVSGSDHLRIQLSVRETRGGAVRPAERSGSLDSLAVLIQGLVTETFAARIAAREAGFRPTLPAGGGPAIRAYLQGERAFRGGSYREAVELFNQVLAYDSTHAYSYFKRMLAEALQLRPTSASTAWRSALADTRAYRAGLDPITGELLAAYELLLDSGVVEQAHEALSSLVARYPEAIDAWFLLGYLQHYLGGLYGVSTEQARVAYQRARELDPGFAAAISQLALIASLNREKDLAQGYFREYLAIDSVSIWAALIRMADSLLFQGDRAALAVRRSLETRDPAALEILSLGGARLSLRPEERRITESAADALWTRAVTGRERQVAFRLRMAGLLGTGRLASADSLLHQARTRTVPEDELDAWVLLASVTGVADLASPDEQRAAANRLARVTGDDPTYPWVVARWAAPRDRALARRARAMVHTIVDSAPRPLARSLLDDLAAHDSLAAGDTAAAVRIWRAATRRFSVDRVMFDLVGSLWPLRLAQARVAHDRGDHAEVLAATEAFTIGAGYLDQLAWSTALPLRAAALRAEGEFLEWQRVTGDLVVVLSAANGRGAAVRDSILREQDALGR